MDILSDLKKKMDTKGKEEGFGGPYTASYLPPRTRESYDWGQVWLHMFPSQYVLYDSRKRSRGHRRKLAQW